jgi:hypothetical protein
MKGKKIMKKKTTKKRGNPATIDRREARAWMVLQGIRAVHIQREMGYPRTGQVNDTLQGRRNDRRVLQWLLDKGCPAAYLKLPAGMAKALLQEAEVDRPKMSMNSEG